MFGREFGAQKTVAEVEILLDTEPDRFLTSLREEGTILALGTRAVRVACVSRAAIRAVWVSVNAEVVLLEDEVEVGLVPGKVEYVQVDPM